MPCRRRRRIAPLVPLSPGRQIVIHADVRMKLSSPLTRQVTTPWSGIDAGRRIQIESSVTAVRHFRAPHGGVKHSAPGKPAAVWMERPILRWIDRLGRLNSLRATHDPASLAST
jgi:hypothetical protein